MRLEDLFLETLKDIFFAERQILKALPRLAKAASDPKLREAFMHHREETEQQVDRLRQVFEILGKRAQGKTCEAINGLVEESEELLEMAPHPSPVRDAGLIATAQAVEHYEMARYGALVAWARALGNEQIAQLLQENLAEEKQADTLLNQMAVTVTRTALAA
ncbi:MAG: ferritin-like domain-containing protein [Alphaproteobacteria bacterium]|nr:ferritin-like domain-containing protein [Alphaproteobacteria bacterium]